MILNFLEEKMANMISHKAKNKNIRLTTYPNIMHDSWTIPYENQEVYDWLLSFKK